MRTVTITLLTFALVTLTACSGNSARPLDEMADEDIITKFENFQAGTEGGLIKPYNLMGGILDNPGRTEISGVPAFKRWWCISKRQDINFYQVARNMYLKKCKAVGGRFVKDWCRTFTDIPIFKAVVGDARVVSPTANCSGSNFLSFGAIAIDGSGMNPVEFERIAENELGYVNAIDLEMEKYKKRELEQAAQIKAEQDARTRESQVLNAGIGGMVCHDYQTRYHNLTEIGYIEEIVNNRIRVRITDVRVTNTSVRPGSGIPRQWAWDEAKNWYVCKYIK